MSKEKNNNSSFMQKIASFIVDKRNIFFLLYIAAFVFSLFSSGWVSVCNDLSEYLPDDTETRQSMNIMDEQFVTYATAKVMVINVTFDEAEDICDRLEALPQVQMVDFDNTEEYYKDASALFEVTLNSEEDDEMTEAGYNAIEELLNGYDVYITKSVEDNSKDLESEMNTVLVVAALIIVGVLFFTSSTYAEVPVMLITFIAAAILNKGTNFIFGEISFVSNSVTVVLQLALSIDYAIIMIHRYSEERETYEQREAVINALSKAIIEISASSLTTVSGLAALMLMQFQIGFDMGIVLIKSIVFSLLSVFTLMPGLLMLFGKYIDKTHHKSFIPKISFLGGIVSKLRYVVPPIFAAVIIISYIVSSGCPFVYSANSSKTSRENETQIAKRMINETFGSENMGALLVPTGDYEKEAQLISRLEQCDEVKSITGLANVKANDDYTLTDNLTPRQFAELADIDIDLSNVIYAMYDTKNEEYASLINNFDGHGVPLIDMFMFLYDVKQDGYVNLDEEMSDNIDELYKKINAAQLQLKGDTYSRILIYMNLPEESEETFAFVDKIHEITEEYYDNCYFVGNSTSDYDLSKSFAKDNIIISVFSILFVIIVLLFTFKSAGLPLLLIAVIQGSIWMNFSAPAITDTPLFFLSYLIVSSIQMGANIDYAIVISNRYLELKKEMSPKQAMTETLSFAFPTVLTSGSILAAAGFLISKLSTEPSIVSIGQCLGRGTVISMFLVMCVLPEILLLGDTLIEKTGFKIKKPLSVKSETGVFMLNGRVRGYVNGFIDADIHGVVKGDVKASIDINNIKSLGEGSEDDANELTAKGEIDSEE